MKPKNEKKVSAITIVGSKMAKEGLQFIFSGPTTACKDCKLFRVCMTNLEPNRLYEITKVRAVDHKCSIHEDGVKTVEVIEPPQTLIVKSRLAIEGVILTWQPPGVDCSNLTCPHWDQCKTLLFRSGDRVRIVHKLEPISCMEGKQLALVLASRVY
ncbi:MAG: UPF0179 family protein [Candidatus Heimdallarchaeota archaeon]